MYEVILFTCDNPEITDQMVELYIQKSNINPRFDITLTTNLLKERKFLRHDSAMVEVIKELNCKGFKIVQLTDDQWRYYSISPDEKINIS
jgi:hypothetical protein